MGKVVLASIYERERHQGKVYCTTHSGQMRAFAWLSCVAPAKEAVHRLKYGGGTWQQFDAAYWTKLRSQRAEVEAWLASLGGEDVTLLCYCNAAHRRAGKCHLHLVYRLIHKYRPDVEVER